MFAVRVLKISDSARPQYEIGKSKGLLPATEAYKLAVQLGYKDHAVIARLLWLCDSAADDNHDGNAVWIRDFYAMLLVASSGNPLDKHHSLLTLNGLTSVRCQNVMTSVRMYEYV